MLAYPLILAAFLASFAAIGSISLSIVPPSQQAAINSGVMSHDVFVLSAKTFMASNPANGSYTWQTLSKLNSSTLLNANVPSSWKLVVYAPGQYVVCTTHAYQPQMMLVSSRYKSGTTPYQLNASTLVTASDSSTAQSKSSLCN